MEVLLVIILLAAMVIFYAMDNQEKLEKEEEKKRMKEYEKEVEDNMIISRQTINNEITAFAESIAPKDYKEGYTGPFGLKSGQFKAHIRVNKEIDDGREFQKDNITRVNIIPPKEFPLFDSYVGLFNCNAELVGVIACRNYIGKDYNTLVNDMRAAFDKTLEIVSNNYGNGRIRIDNTYEMFCNSQHGMGILHFNKKVVNGDIIFTGEIRSDDSFADEQRFLNEDIDFIQLRAKGKKTEDTEYPYETFLCLVFGFNNYPYESIEDSKEANINKNIEEKINLLYESF